MNNPLNKILEYQLLEHRKTNKQSFSLPEPTIAKLGGAEYFIITDISDNDKMPSVCLFKIQPIIS